MERLKKYTTACKIVISYLRRRARVLKLLLHPQQNNTLRSRKRAGWNLQTARQVINIENNASSIELRCSLTINCQLVKREPCIKFWGRDVNLYIDFLDGSKCGAQRKSQDTKWPIYVTGTYINFLKLTSCLETISLSKPPDQVYFRIIKSTGGISFKYTFMRSGAFSKNNDVSAI